MNTSFGTFSGRKIFLMAFTVFILLCSTRVFAQNHTKISVLFIGNSFTSVNDLPKTFAGIANSLGDQVDYQMVAQPGFTLQQHTNNAATVSAIQSGHWNYVVLQEQSEIAAFPDEQFQSMSMPYAAQLAKLSTAKPVVFETWGYKNGDSHFCNSLSYFCSYDGMQQAIANNSFQLINNINAIVVPVGSAWKIVRDTHPDIELYQGDDKHPSVAGTYLAACVFYEVLFGKSVIGATPLSLDSSVAAVLQKAAVQAVYGKS